MNGSRLKTKAIVSAAAALLINTACTSDRSPVTPTAAIAASGEALAINFETRPDPPRSGANSIEVAVRQPDGRPLTDAAVTATFRMPAMPSMNMPEMSSVALLSPQGQGAYRGNAQLAMAGTWNVTVTVSRNGQPLGSQRFTVIAQ
jgi:nitrogen fixation protein FixH